MHFSLKNKISKLLFIWHHHILSTCQLVNCFKYEFRLFGPPCASSENHFKTYIASDPEAVFLVMCDPSMNELWVTETGLWINLYGPKSLTACSWKGRTQLKIQPHNILARFCIHNFYAFSFDTILVWSHLLLFIYIGAASRVTWLGDFLPTGLHLDVHSNFWERWSNPKKLLHFGLLFASYILLHFDLNKQFVAWHFKVS